MKHQSMNRCAAAALFLSCFWAGGDRDAAAQQTVTREGKEYSVNPQVMADRIMKEVAEIRGLKFKHTLDANFQSLTDFDKFMDGELKEEMPELRMESIGKVVKKLGLYRGPEIKDMFGMVKTVMKSQAAAYYDPKTKAFYVLMGDMPELMLGTVYAHELYHGLQDQYFDLEKYMKAKKGNLSDDEQMARQAVVEGEATYIMLVWAMKKMIGSEPDPRMLEAAVEMQANMDAKELREQMKSDPIAQEMSKGMEGALQAMDEIPPFLLETLIGSYTKGTKFVFEVHKQGWEKVEELYKNPPASTEQILYPEKWLKGENPVKFEWAGLEKEKALKGWKLLDENVIGEIQFRIIFSEFGMESESESASAGWNGDRFAVLQKGEDLLLLLATSWDSADEAGEFAAAYRKLLKKKYDDPKYPASVEVDGANVYVVEGGEAGDKDELVKIVKMAKREK